MNPLAAGKTVHVASASEKLGFGPKTCNLWRPGSMMRKLPVSLPSGVGQLLIHIFSAPFTFYPQALCVMAVCFEHSPGWRCR